MPSFKVNRRSTIAAGSLAVVALASVAVMAVGQPAVSSTITAATTTTNPTTFTYQGVITFDGAAAVGPLDLRFSLFTADTGGIPLGPSVELLGTTIDDAGRFTASLDFGQSFDATPRWLEIEVRDPSATTDFVVLGRQPVSPAPTSQFALEAGRVEWDNVSNRPEIPDGHSLDAVDGDPVDAVFVDEDGNTLFSGDVTFAGATSGLGTSRLFSDVAGYQGTQGFAWASVGSFSFSVPGRGRVLLFTSGETSPSPGFSIGAGLSHTPDVFPDIISYESSGGTIENPFIFNTPIPVESSGPVTIFINTRGVGEVVIQPITAIWFAD